MAVHNNGGCDALTQKVTYSDRKRERQEFHKSGMPWWASGKANLILVSIFSAMDGMVLFSIFDECLTQSVLMGIIMAFGVAVILNVLPLIIARFVHAAFEKTTKNAILMMCIFIVGFILIYGGTVYLRFAYSDMYGQESQSMELENVVSDEKMYTVSNNSSSDSSKGTAVVLLLSISPLITSLLGFGIAYVSDDETKKKIEYLEIEKIQIDEKISDTQAAIAQMENALNEGVKRDLDLDKIAMDAAIEEIVARCDILKSLARLYLSEYLANPSATSKISQEMLVESEDSGEKTCENASEYGNMTDSNDKVSTADKVA